MKVRSYMCYQSRRIQTKRWKRANTKHNTILPNPKKSFIRESSAQVIVFACRVMQNILTLIQRTNSTNALHKLHYVSHVLHIKFQTRLTVEIKLPSPLRSPLLSQYIAPPNPLCLI